VKARFRIVLPCAIGALSAVLTAWDVYNWKIISAMGMAWDTGAPIWPYQTSDILLRLINFPAFVAAMPLANGFILLAPRYHFVVFPAGLVWWWIVGLGLDLQRASQPHRRSWSAFVPLLICFVLLTLAAIAEWTSVLDWYRKYGGDLWSINKIGILRLVTPTLWFAGADIVVAIAAKTALIERRS
jgi:hypothetical protein